jgi:hypothetical protein
VDWFKSILKKRKDSWQSNERGKMALQAGYQQLPVALAGSGAGLKRGTLEVLVEENVTW